MNKNKKLMLGFSAGSFLFAFVAIFMGFLPGVVGKFYESGKLADEGSFNLFKDIMFGKFLFSEGTRLKNQWAAVLAFVVLLIAILVLATIVVLNITNKSSKKLNIGLMVGAIVLLAISFIIMFALTAILNFADREVAGYKWVYNLGSGAICWAIFSLISVVGCGIALGQNKKVFASK